MICKKRPYQSSKQAKRANRKASFRFSVYWCDGCRAYHVTNRQKRMDKVGRRFHSKRAYT